MTEQLPRIGDTIDLGLWDENSDAEHPANQTGTVIALMGLQQAGRWGALIVVDLGTAWKLGRYRTGWTFRSDAYLPDMHSHDTAAQAMEYLPAWWRRVDENPRRAH